MATTRRCRQLEILEYFGDPDRKRCGICDNCGNTKDLGPVSDKTFGSPDACLYAVQVAISGAARTHGRFGKTLIAQMLTGSTSKKIKQLGLDRIPTHGLLTSLRQADVVDLLDFLLARGYLSQVETTKFRPTMQVTDSGRQVMLGAVDLDFTTLLPLKLAGVLSSQLKNKKPHRSHPTIETTEPTDTAEQDQVREPQEEPQRQTLTATSDAFLLEPLAPNDEPELVDDSIGLGFEMDLASEADEALEDENEAFAEEEAEKEGDDPEIETPMSVPPETASTSPTEHSNPNQSPTNRIIRRDLPETSSIQPSFYWTWQLIVDGYSVEHIGQTRGIDRAAVFDHANRALQSGRAVQVDWLLDSEKVAVLQQLIRANPDSRMPALMAQLPAGIESFELQFFMKANDSSNR